MTTETVPAFVVARTNGTSGWATLIEWSRRLWFTNEHSLVIPDNRWDEFYELVQRCDTERKGRKPQ